MLIRELNPVSDSEIRLVAQRMRLTLIEVLGEEEGTKLYTLDWLVDRVRWHLDPARTARIFLSETRERKITGHGIARVERDEAGEEFGYFSTLYVEPQERRQGVARQLISEVENWFKQLNMPKVVYNTAEDHHPILKLFTHQGYEITLREAKMVQLTRRLRESPAKTST